MSIWIIVVGVVVLLVLCLIKIYNSMVRLKLLVDNAKSQISVQLKSRWDLVENLIGATGEYSEYEKSTLMDIVKTRTPISNASTVGEIAQSESELANVLGKLSVVVEAYPELKASEIYKETMQSTKEMENDVKQARMVYNDIVTRFNRFISVVPNVFFASIFGFKPYSLIEHTAQESQMPRW